LHTLSELILQDTCLQEIRIIIPLTIYYYYEALWMWLYVIFLYWLRQVLLTRFSWVCRIWMSRMLRHQWNPWTPDRVREWTIGVWLLYIYDIVHLVRWYDYEYYFWHDSLMMHADDSLPTRLTCGVEGSRTTTRDVEGEVDNNPTTTY
jgi:hypothetical protein